MLICETKHQAALRPSYITDQRLIEFIKNALTEDVGNGDHSSLASVPADHQGTARLLVKTDGVLAGVYLANLIFNYIDPELMVHVMIQDGEQVHKGDIALTVKGRGQSILKAERLVLNCMQRMSGIATYTRKMVNMIAGTHAKLLDTRKTTPNFRMCEKWAVTIGGGTNHRFGLFDMIMLKDNHVDLAGGVRPALSKAKAYVKTLTEPLAIEVETRSLAEVAEVLEEGGAQRIMFDNMTTEQMRKAVLLVNGKAETEASGGITEENIRQIAETGVDFISSGALTYAAKPLDLSLKIQL